jgi:4-amino-4-deoxy-L-arabinose transferase-like glycosyltransferase
MRIGLAALALLSLLVLFPGLQSVGWLDVREARDQAVAIEMIDRREPFTPVLGGDPLFDKPLLGYALNVACALPTDGGPLASRTANALIGVALAAVTGVLGARLFGARAGILSAGALLTMTGLPFTARTDGTQLQAALLGWLACAAFAEPLLRRTPGGSVRLILGWGALGFALLVGGPLPALWPLAGIGLYLLLRRGAGGWSTLQPFAGGVLALAIALPWYASSLERHGATLAAALPFFPYAANPRGSWLRGPVDAFTSLAACGYPWSAMLPAAALHAATWWRTPGRRGAPPRAGDGPAFVIAEVEAQLQHEAAAHLLLAWLVAGVLPVLFYPRAPLGAALPALPAMALLCGRLVDHLLEDPARLRAMIAGAARLLALVGTALAVLATLAATRLPEAAGALRLFAALSLVAAWVPFLASFMGRSRLAALLFALPVAIGAPVVALRVLPEFEGYLNTRAVAARVMAGAPRDAALVLVDPPPPSLRLCTWRNLVVANPDAASLARWRASDGATWLAFAPAREAQVVRAAGAALDVLLRTPTLVLVRVRG